MGSAQANPDSQSPRPGQEETLVAHLAELRIRLIRALIAIIVASAVCWIYSETIFDLIRAPIMPFLKVGSGGGLVFTAPMDKFLAHIKVALFSGLIVASPYWLWQIWQFVAPGLYVKEKRFALIFMGAGTVLFLAGVSFVYFVVYPLAFEYLMQFGGTTDMPMITISEYLSFFTTTTIIFGLAFELPLILVLLGMAGIIDQKFLREKRRYAVVALAAVSAVATPPDILSMILMMGPMLFLYEISVLLVGRIGSAKTPE